MIEQDAGADVVGQAKRGPAGLEVAVGSGGAGGEMSAVGTGGQMAEVGGTGGAQGGVDALAGTGGQAGDAGTEAGVDAGGAGEAWSDTERGVDALVVGCGATPIMMTPTVPGSCIFDIPEQPLGSTLYVYGDKALLEDFRWINSGNAIVILGDLCAQAQAGAHLTVEITFGCAGFFAPVNIP
jgi:hypothetical protein